MKKILEVRFQGYAGKHERGIPQVPTILIYWECELQAVSFLMKEEKNGS